jgi:pseudaminic acid cytidylyltransferase
LGRPVICYSIATAIESGLFSQVVVSTDDGSIARISSDAGALVPFMRPPALASDEATTDEVLLHAIEECSVQFGVPTEVCCIYPTTPLLIPSDLHDALNVLLESGAATSLPVVRYEAPIEQAFSMNGARLTPRWPEKILSRSQDLPMAVHDAGQFYWCNVEKFCEKRALFNDETVGWLVPLGKYVDINSESDWLRAEQLAESRRLRR